MLERRSVGTAVLALTAALAVAAPAEANKISHRGSIVGIDSATVRFKVVKQEGELQRVINLRFNDVPVNCADGSSGLISAQLPNFGIDGNKFTRKGPIRGVGIEGGTLRAFGKLRQNGKQAKGNVRIAFKSSADSGCGTSPLEWRTG